MNIPRGKLAQVAAVAALVLLAGALLYARDRSQASQSLAGGRYASAAARLSRWYRFGVWDRGSLKTLLSALSVAKLNPPLLLAAGENCAAHFPESAACLLGEAAAEEQLDRLDEAKALLMRVLELEFTSVPAHFRLAGLAEKREEFALAYGEYQTIIGLQKDSPQAYPFFRLVRLANRFSRHALAMDYLRPLQDLSENEKSVEGYLAAAETYDALGRAEPFLRAMQGAEALIQGRKHGDLYRLEYGPLFAKFAQLMAKLSRHD